MGNEGEYQIKITGDASSMVAATQQSNAALESTKIKLSDLSPETKAYIKKLEETKDASKELDISHRNLRMGLHLLGPEFAEVGHLGIAAFANPLTAGLMAAGVMAGKLISDWQKLKEAIASAPDVEGIEKVTEALGQNGMLKALIEGGVAIDEFWTKLDRLATAQESLKNKTDDATDTLAKQHQGDDKIMSAREKAELAELKLAKTRGQLSPGAYEIKKGEIEDRYAGQRANRQAIEQDAGIEARKHEREGNQRIIAEGPETVGQKQRAAEEAKGRLEGQKSELEEWKKALAKIDDWMSKQGTAALSSREGRETYAVQGKARILALTQIEEREQGTIPAAERAAKTTAADLAGAQRGVENAQSRANELDRDIPKLEANRTRDRATQAEEVPFNRRAWAADVQDVFAQDLQRGQDAQAHLQQQMIKSAHSGGPVNAAVLDAFHAQEAHNIAVAKELADYAKRLRRIEGTPPQVF